MTETHTFLPCPFCGGEARIMERPQSGNDTGFFCSISCFCGKYSTRAHQHGIAETAKDARAEALTAWNTRADSHHRLVEALEAFAFVGEDNPEDTQAVWEMIYRDRVQDWFSYEDFERARDLLAALKEAGRG